jgi:hypothetical protein
MKIIKTIFSALLALLFLTFAAVQYNDPDPLIWIVVYGYTAAIAILAVFNRHPRALILLGMAAVLGGIVYLAPSVYQWLMYNSDVSLIHGMAPDKPFIEESRECFGLLIVLASLIYHYIAGSGKYVDVS